MSIIKLHLLHLNPYSKKLIVIRVIADENPYFSFFPLITLRKIKKDLLKNKIVQNQHNPQKHVGRFQTEIETWKQLLNSGMEENVLLKNKLADILKNDYDQSSLEEIEEFQTKFIREDELIHSLRRDVNELENFLYRRIFEGAKIEKLFDSKLENLRKDIANSVIRFCILKSAFNCFQHKISAKREN